MSSSIKNVAEILANCKLFADVPESAFQLLAGMARICKFARRETIFQYDDECPGVYVVAEGLVRVFKLAPNGKEHVLQVCGAGQTFAEVAAIGDFECPAAAEALRPTTCVLLPKFSFQRAIKADHALCRGMLTGMAGWVRELVGLMETVVLRDAVGRVAQYLLGQPSEDGFIKLSAMKRHVASHLNLASETFSRALRRLADAKIIAEETGSSVRILDEDKLSLVAQGLFPVEKLPYPAEVSECSGPHG